MDILLVEDHPIVRDGLKRLLSAIPAAAVREETTGRGALAAVRARRPDLMILDLNLPDIGGLDVLGRLKREDPPFRVLVLTMHGEPIYAVRALEAGARGYLSKGAAPDELMMAIKAVSQGRPICRERHRPGHCAQGRGGVRTAGRPVRARSRGAAPAGWRPSVGGCRRRGCSWPIKPSPTSSPASSASSGCPRTIDLVRLAVELNSV